MGRLSTLTTSVSPPDTEAELSMAKAVNVRHAVTYKSGRSKLLPLADDITRLAKPDRWAIGAPSAPGALVNHTDNDFPFSRAVTGHIAPDAR
jgi:hypothetical protein